MKISILWTWILFQIYLAVTKGTDLLTIIRPGKLNRFDINLYEQKMFRISKKDLRSNTQYDIQASFLGSV